MQRLQKILSERMARGTPPNALFQAAVESMPMGLAVLDLRGRIQYANASYCRISGGEAEELPGRELAGMYLPRDAEAIRTGFARLQHGAKGSISIQGRQQRPEGHAIWVQTALSLLRDAKGRPYAGLAFVEDVTAQHRSEDTLHATEVLLHRSEKLAAAGRQAATVAHEINNPIEAVNNLIYLAMHEQGLPDGSLHYLQMANEELRRVSTIVSQTLGFYRDSAAVQTIDIAQLVDELLMLYQHKLDMRQICVTRSMEPALVEGIPGELRQVITNLLSNALDAMESSGVLGIEVRAMDDEVRLSISDTGHGIDRLLLDRIFDPFFTTKQERGTGLGLWVAKGIVEKHHGRLEVVSSQNPDAHGTEFRVTLPRRMRMLQSA